MSLFLMSADLLSWLGSVEPAIGKGKKTSSGKMSLIVPGLYCGNRSAAADRDLLNRCQVKAILNAGAGKQVQAELDFMKVSLRDSANAKLSCELINSIVDLIDARLSADESSSVLVHCMGGMSRSASVCIGYLIGSRQLTFDEALAVVLKQRPRARLNVGFQRQLIAYEKKQVQS
jgi:protein-tyrosine phosphatase